MKWKGTKSDSAEEFHSLKNPQENTMANTVEIHQRMFVGILLLGALILYLLYSWLPDNTSNRSYVHQTWKTRDFVDVPLGIFDKAEEIPKPVGKHISFMFNKEKVEIFQRDITPKDNKKGSYSVLLLHGASFSSKTWVDIKTMRLIAAMGYRVVAVDLPGYGGSKSSVVKDKDKAAFLKEFIKQKGLGSPIIVTPSMSGQFAIPYLMTPSAFTCRDRVSALVAVAPVMTEKYTASKYHRCEIPAMIVFGGKDKDMGLRSVGNLRNLANNEIITMEGAGHAAYLDDPEEWSKLIFNFLLAVERDNPRRRR